MRILVIGGGGREHALVHALSQDSAVSELHASPGNDGMRSVATLHPEGDAVELARSINADLVVIGPEIPLVEGVSDQLREAGFAVFGPSQNAAQIEGSKQFAKDVMAAAGVRTAASQQILPGAEDAEIEAALDRFGPQWVVKDDGLAAGKGVVVTTERSEARAHIDEVLAADNPVLMEEFLSGPEISLFCLVDGETVVPLIPAQDHKRVGDNDAGPNTGGMGAYAPLPWLPAEGTERILKEVCEPVAAEMARRGTPYSGLLYAGLAWTAEGPAVIEFNARFGDPETQPVLSLLDSSLAELLAATARGQLAEVEPPRWREGYALTVVLASEGYPASSTKGVRLDGPLDDPNQVIHAGTAFDEEAGTYLTNGGRVLNVMGFGATLDQARENAYAVVDKISFPNAVYRTDIARRAAKGEITLP